MASMFLDPMPLDVGSPYCTLSVLEEMYGEKDAEGKPLEGMVSIDDIDMFFFMRSVTTQSMARFVTSMIQRGGLARDTHGMVIRYPGSAKGDLDDGNSRIVEATVFMSMNVSSTEFNLMPAG